MLGYIRKVKFSSGQYKYVNKSIVNQVGVIELNRPSALNALKDELFDELNDCLTDLDND